MKNLKLMKLHFDPYITVKQIIQLLLLLTLVVTIYGMFILVPAFLSDESIYEYASYAILKGVVPYRQITLVHPPIMYLAYAIPIYLSGSNLLVTRTFSLFIVLLDVILTYFLARKLQLPHSLSLLASALYALWPSTIPFALTSLLSNLVIMFGLTAFILYVKGKPKTLFLSGFMMGLAMMTWYLALFLFLSLLTYHVIRSVWQKMSVCKVMIDSTVIVSGSLIPIVFFLVWIGLVWHATTFFYSQTFMLHITRETLTVMEKWISIATFAEYFSPIILLSVIGAMISTIHFKSYVSNFFMLTFVSLAYTLFLFFMVKTLLVHYLFILTPFLAILSAFTFQTANRALSNLKESHAKSETKLFLVILFSLLLVTGIVTNVQKYSFYAPYLRFGYVNPSNQIDFYIGSRIAGLTSPDEKIWTSEPAIAFFAQRLIMPPNSTMWPLQGFFYDVFDAPFVDAYGVTHEGKGLVKPSQFIESWETHDVKVIVFIRGSGAVPYPDNLLWEGFGGERGVKEWVEQNFKLEEIVVSPDVGYTYYIWLRGK